MDVYCTWEIVFYLRYRYGNNVIGMHSFFSYTQKVAVDMASAPRGHAGPAAEEEGYVVAT